MDLHALRFGIAAAALILTACGGDDGDSAGSGDTGTPGAGSTTGGSSPVAGHKVSGTVVDFETGAPVAGGATISTAGLTPPPTVSVTGADFSITGVAPHSVFHLLSGAPPDHRSTYDAAVSVEDADVTGIEAAVVSEAFLTGLQTGFAVSPAPGTGVVLAHVVDDTGAPKAGVPASAFTLNGAAAPHAPLFLDDAKKPSSTLKATSASGYVVFYDVPAGLTTFGAATGSGVGFEAASAPAAATTVTLIELVVTAGEVAIPTGVSFASDVVPIFSKRGCDQCHSGNSIGADLGELTLNGSAKLIHKELTEEISPNHMTTRVNLEDPPASLVLRMPSFEDPPDAHPNATFASPTDPDYLTLLGWIKEGAKEN